jgi:hypothetical protein
MKNLLLTLLLFPFLLGNTTSTNEVEHDLLGVWHDEFNKESLQISRNEEFDITFKRVTGYTLLSMGNILESHDGLIEVERKYPQKETYTLKYVFSPSKKTLVVTKPNSNEAWVFTRYN